jgi:hypothetical protein
LILGPVRHRRMLVVVVDDDDDNSGSAGDIARNNNRIVVVVAVVHSRLRRGMSVTTVLYSKRCSVVVAQDTVVFFRANNQK